jgi:GDP-D-mannose 3',5'-epimerase
MVRALVLGGNGFIGHHLARRLKKEGYFVTVADIKQYEYGTPNDFSDRQMIGDLRDPAFCDKVFRFPQDEIYQLAADMGGAGYIFSGENDANVMHNSAQINLNVVSQMAGGRHKKVFYSSSACMYPAYNQEDPNNPNCKEDSAYPAAPDSEYGWEKLFSERLFLAFHRNFKTDVRIARFHNIFGPEGTYKGGKEKAPAALCRKVIESDGEIEVWGDGSQTRSFLYIDECLEGIRRLMCSKFTGPVNIGSDEMISINDLAKMVIAISGKEVRVKNIPGPTGVRGRNSDNTLIDQELGWKPTQPLRVGMEKTYKWIYDNL